MTDDIVARLRKGTRTPYGLPVQSDEARLHITAADEIERLRAERDALRELLREAREWLSGKSQPWANLTPVLARIDAALKGDGE